MNNSLVSVIIPFFNRPSSTIRAIKSVLNQTYKQYKILIINDGSLVDISCVLDFCSGKNNIKILYQNNMGPANARNKGINNAKGRFIAFLDSDDEWHKDKLKLQINFMLENKIIFSYTSYSIKNTHSKNIKKIDAGKNLYKYPYIIFHNKIATPTVIIDTSKVKNFLFPQNIYFGEDQILWIKLSKYNCHGNLNLDLAIIHHDKETTALDFKKKYKAFIAVNNSLVDTPLIKFIHMLYIKSRNLIKR